MSLQEIHEFPELCDHLVDGKWHYHFTSTTRERGKKYFKEGKISKPEFELFGNEEYLFRGECQGSSKVPYNQVAYFTHKRSGWRLQTHCTCPVEIDCKHVAALIQLIVWYLENGAQAEQQIEPLDVLPEFEHWLAGFNEKEELDAKPSSPTANFLAYCMRYDERNNDMLLQLHVGRTLKSGEVRINFRSNAFPNLENPPKYLTAEDISPVILYRKQYRSWGYGISLFTPSAHSFLLEAVKTGHLFLIEGKQTIIPITTGPPLEVEPSWKLLDDGTAFPLIILPEDSHTIYTEPLLVICPATGSEPATLCPLHSKNLTPKQLAHWENGPVLKAQQVAQATEILTKKSPNLPLPVQLKTELLQKSKPIPHLHLHRANPFTHGGLHLSGKPKPIIATLSFEYHGEKIQPDLTQNNFNKASHFFVKDGIRYEIPRDHHLEADSYEFVTQGLNLEPVSTFDSYSVHPDHKSALLPYTEPSDWDMAWANTISSSLDLLREAGWQVTIDPSAKLEIHDIGQDALLTDLTEDPDHGIDWFQFQASYLTPEGKQQALLPLLGGFLESVDLAKIDEILSKLPEDHKTVLRDPNNPNAFLAFPSIPLFTLAKNIFELFGESSPEAPIHRLQAAAIADSLDLDTSQTLKDLAALGHNLKNITSLPQPKIPAAVKADLRDYQREGFYWMQFLARHGLHGILADDMGLGKTLQTLAHIQAEVSAKRTNGRPCLVIAPTSVVGNWKNEAARFTPKLKVLVLHGADRHDNFSEIKKHHLVLTTYPLLVRDFDELVKIDYHLLALDEAQYIKNPAAKAAQSACKLKAAHRMALSGTPIENHLGELWSQMRFLMPGLLGSSEVFRKHFRTPIEKHHDSNAQKTLNARVASLILRRTKEKVATELPPKTTIIHKIPLNKKQIDLYETIRAAMDSRIRDAISSKGLAKSQIIVLDALLKLRQICCHPQLLKIASAKKVTDSAKLDFLTKDLLPTLLEEKRKILLFSTFTSMLQLIEDHLVAKKISFTKITGQTKDRQSQIDEFQDTDVPIFLISLKAGGTGLNLTAADTVIHYDPWWNPAAENQATDRAYRIGQDKPVFVHKLICEGSIEQRIQDLQNQKSALVDALFTDDTSKLKIDQSTLQNLLAPIA